VVVDNDGRLLVIRRGRPPGQGLWSLPGGRVEPGETDAAAVIRELREETGLEVTVGRLIGSVDRPGLDGATYDIHDYAATVGRTGGQTGDGSGSGSGDQPGDRLRPGDDATDARWVTPAEFRALPTTPALLDALSDWGVLTAASDRFGT
jgi:8-oxo-dGTP diphosphatase